MEKNNKIIADTIYFWRMVIGNPIRLICVIVALAIIWLGAGWIFHPINSVITVIVNVIIIVAISGFIASLGYLQKINWRSRLHQNIANRCTIGLAVIAVLYEVWGYRHLILFTIVSVIIVAVALKDIVFHK